MKQTVDFQTFRDTFRAYDRADNFTREGMELLFNYLEQYEQESGVEVELNVIALCCDYSENTVSIIALDYRIDIEGLDDNEARDAVRGYLEYNTTVVGETVEGFVYACF